MLDKDGQSGPEFGAPCGEDEQTLRPGNFSMVPPALDARLEGGVSFICDRLEPKRRLML